MNDLDPQKISMRIKNELYALGYLDKDSVVDAINKGNLHYRDATNSFTKNSFEKLKIWCGISDQSEQSKGEQQLSTNAKRVHAMLGFPTQEKLKQDIEKGFHWKKANICGLGESVYTELKNWCF